MPRIEKAPDTPDFSLDTPLDAMLRKEPAQLAAPAVVKKKARVTTAKKQTREQRAAIVKPTGHKGANRLLACTVPGCDKFRHSKNAFCAAHSRRAYLTGSPTRTNLDLDCIEPFSDFVRDLFTNCGGDESVMVGECHAILRGAITSASRARSPALARFRVLEADGEAPVDRHDLVCHVVGVILLLKLHGLLSDQRYSFMQIGLALNALISKHRIEGRVVPDPRSSISKEGQEMFRRLRVVCDAIDRTAALTREHFPNLLGSVFPPQGFIKTVAAITERHEPQPIEGEEVPDFEPETVEQQQTAPSAPPATPQPAAPDAAAIRAALERLRNATKKDPSSEQ